MKNRPLLYVCLMIMFIIILAVLCGKGRIIKELCPSPLESAVFQGETVIVQGQVYNLEQKGDYQVLYLRNNSIQKVQSEKLSFQESKVIAYIDSSIQINIGNELQVQGEVSFFQNARNPGNFDQKRYYEIRDIHGMIWVTEVKVTNSELWKLKDCLVKFRKRWKDVLISVMGEEDGSIMGAIMLGEKSDMNQEMKSLYQANGIGHILAISGLHLSFVGIGIYQFFRRISGSYPLGGIVGILFLTLYIVMIGLTVSAVRAFVMFLFRAGADMTGRHYDAPTALAAAAMLVLLWRPLYLFDGGFWLSFGAVFAVLAVLPVFQKFFLLDSMIQKHVVLMSLTSGLCASVSINAVILPVLLYYFFEFPPYSLLLNIFVIPLMSVLLFLGIVGSLFYMIVMPISGISLDLCRMILWIYAKSCGIAIRLPGARIVTGKPELWQMIVYYGILLAVLLVLKSVLSKLSVSIISHTQKEQKIMWRKRNLRMRICVVLIWGISIFILTYRWGEAGRLTATVLDVGQGDGIFVKGPDGGTYLVDGGSSDVKSVGRYRIESFLKSQGVGKLDYVFISHGDSDHMNGVEELISRQEIGVEIGTLVLPVQEVWDEGLEELAYIAKNAGIEVVVMQPGQSLREDEMSITCLQPGVTQNDKNDELRMEPGNAASMILAVQYGEFDMLLTGDVEEEGEEYLTDTLKSQYSDCTWEVLKVAHHGSKNSSSEEFLDVVQPIYACISAGQDNRYGHPHQETLERIEGVGSRIYSTQESGAVMIIVKDGRMYIRNNL